MAARLLPLRASSSTGPCLLLRRSLALSRPSFQADAAPAQPSSRPSRPERARAAKLFDDFAYDETTAEGHAMIDKERDALAFMRTVELELPRLVPIPFTPPDVEKEYLRFHTSKTWPLEEESPEPTWVTLSAPIARLPFASPEAKHKFLLLITPHYYHPFRPAAFSLKDEFTKQHANQPRSDRARHRKHVSARERKDETILTETTLPANLLTEQPPRVGGHTPANVPFMGFSKRTRGWVQGLKRVDEDRTYIQGLNDREGEDKDGWFVVRSKKFGYQLQNKKWCVDLLKRLVEAANDPSDTMADIPVDTSSFTTQFMLEKRRPDGSRPSWRDIPSAWALSDKVKGTARSARSLKTAAAKEAEEDEEVEEVEEMATEEAEAASPVPEQQEAPVEEGARPN